MATIRQSAQRTLGQALHWNKAAETIIRSVNKTELDSIDTKQPPTEVGGLVSNGLKVRIRVG